MAAIDETRVVGRGSVNFASEKDIDEFVNLLGKFESGEMAPDDWRRYRLTRGTYGQRQDGVQMLRVKAPQGVVSSGQMRAFATVAVEVLARVRPCDDAAEHPAALRAAEGLRGRDAHPRRRGPDHARGLRQRRSQRDRLPLHGHVVERDLRRLSLCRGADPLLPAASARRGAAAQVQDRVRGLHRRITRSPRSTTSAGAPGSRTASAASA